MGRLEQLSIGTMDKKRDFSRSQVFHCGNFLALQPEKSGEIRRLIGSIPAHISSSKSIASSAKLRFSCGSGSNIL
jgi:hypothetical protein